MIDSAIILAGGFGTRLQEVVKNVPKPMAPIKGRPFLEWQMDYWIEQGIRNFILSVGYRYQDIQSHFADAYRSASIDYVIENTPLGTGGGLLMAIKKLDLNNPLLLLNGDTFFEINLKEFDEFAISRNAEWCFSMFSSRECDRYMSLQFDSNDGRLTGLKSDVENTERYVNGGVYWVNPKSLGKIKAEAGNCYSLENDLIPQMIIEGIRTYGFYGKGKFIDIGLPKDYLRAHKIIC